MDEHNTNVDRINERIHQRAIEGKLDTIISILMTQFSGKLAKEVMTLKEAAEFLGVSRKTLQKHARKEIDPAATMPFDQIPCRKSFGRWYFTRRSLLEWIENE